MGRSSMVRQPGSSLRVRDAGRHRRDLAAQRSRRFAARGRRWRAPIVAMALALLLASCSSSSSGPPASNIPNNAATRARIATNWRAFFAGSTAASRKIALLENGQSFAAIIGGQAASPLAKSVTATVSKVTVVAPARATVRYSLSLGGKPALTDQDGVAVLQGGTWKVGTASFCALLTLEQVTTDACPAPSSTT